MGMLQFVVEPWAQVSVDGSVLGLTPLQRIRLSPGPHAVVLTHPDYQPFQRKVTIRPGETFKLAVDLRSDGVRKKR